jgi:hypothetical protein
MLPGFVTTGARFVLVTVQVNVLECAPPVAVAVATTVYVRALVYGRVPVIRPVVELSERPGGRPVAEYVIASPFASVAESCSATTLPSALVRFPGFVRTGAT